jgi:hypothetical protein
MDIICINDTFSPEQIAEIPNRPVKDKLYSMRDVIFYPDLNETGFLLNEIENPHLPTTRYGVEGTFEPTFNSKRFTTLNGDSITDEHISEFKKSTKYVKIEMPMLRDGSHSGLSNCKTSTKLF